ncbi:MAG TPA: hypothetical protein VGD49_00925, partial [Longimicrobiales bacterium]
MTLTFRMVRGLDGYLQIRNEWMQVLNRIERPEFFHQYAWYGALLEAWPAVAAEMFFIIAYRGDVAIAVCPLQLTQSRMHGMRLRTLAPPDPNDVAYPDFICDRADYGELFPALIDHLRSQRDISWDVLTLPRIFASDATAHTLA